MTLESICIILILVFVYIFISIACIQFVFGEIEEKLWSGWILSDKTKFNKIVYLLKLENINQEDITLSSFPICKKEQPFWYKLLEIFVGFGLSIPLLIIAGIWVFFRYVIYNIFKWIFLGGAMVIEWLFNLNFKFLNKEWKD